MNTKRQNEKRELVPSAGDDDDIILSQELLSTPDYLTPENQFPLKGFNSDMDKVEEDLVCPGAPKKPCNMKIKISRMDDGDALSSDDVEPVVEVDSDREPLVDFGSDFVRKKYSHKQRTGRYRSLSAMALMRRVTPPACVTNPYLKNISAGKREPFIYQRSTSPGLCPSLVGGRRGLSRYHNDFNEIEKIGSGNFGNVFKVLRRVDGCLYAVKQTSDQLCKNSEWKAYDEVQSLAAIGFQENIRGYYSSWIENKIHYIQMELCDHSLSMKSFPASLSQRYEIEVLYQISSALQFIHGKGIAHLDVKPENIYVKSGVYKLGGFGYATLLDDNVLVEAGDAQYMPLEILNENYDHLDKADIFSLGASMFDIIRRSRLPRAETEFSKLKEGKVPHLPGVTVQFQNLLKVMMDPDPLKRPSATEILGNSIFGGSLKMT
ncbi:wee1-like protein kinase [Vigna unguiculata]|uniref:wee1-like protein kinase n=1 Tax=Vigna unguiculata TaxID=3917 RepID=UPI001016BC0B|nr:wee1-like protein kinase [Vigna unguiculata]